MSRNASFSQNSVFALIYSDISEKLGLQSADRVRELCAEHGLIILEERKRNFLEAVQESSYEDFADPLQKFKAESKVCLYIMTHA